MNVAHAVVVVDDGFVCGVVEQRVDRKVAAACVFFLAPEHVVVQDAPLLVGGFVVSAAKGGDFEGFWPHQHMHDAETPSNNAGAAEQVVYLLWRGIGGDVKVFGVRA